MPFPDSPRDWMNAHCPLLDGQFVFLDPQWWDTHLLSDGAVEVLREAARAIESDHFEAFLQDVEAAGGWPPGLERLAHALTTLPGRSTTKGQPE
ncbi:hypothetical protein [Thauera humireducens]|uniref:Uncharacterized protein n=1 Tax=Thauera humireducens TaxID=1134435 RepID=A0A127K5S2_9RHOO|nr:hypothetical protein [Thauera humireducens]AMO37307.1 hypothetical protein AC731_010285 [Thauera humireducens]